MVLKSIQQMGVNLKGIRCGRSPRTVMSSIPNNQAKIAIFGESNSFLDLLNRARKNGVEWYSSWIAWCFSS